VYLTEGLLSFVADMRTCRLFSGENAILSGKYHACMAMHHGNYTERAFKTYEITEEFNILRKPSHRMEAQSSTNILKIALNMPHNSLISQMCTMGACGQAQV
jgi:hypothetical protein